jgi:hypothetical protein
MTTTEYVVFVGAPVSLSDELRTLEKSISKCRVIAVPARKHEIGLTLQSTVRAAKGLAEHLRKVGNLSEWARLSVWSFEPDSIGQFQHLWAAFGRSAWIELLPHSLLNKNRPTRVAIEAKLKGVPSLIEEISRCLYGKRKTSPFSLPFENFSSSIVNGLKLHWYQGVDADLLKDQIKITHERFKKAHTVIGRRRHKIWHQDERGLIFCAAANGECHGQPHPTGSTDTSFLNGRFRFGAALYPGHHYDVSAKNGKLDCVLFDSEGRSRDMRPEKRDYINMFPNNYLLPSL